MWRDLIVAMFVSAGIGASGLLYDRYTYWRAYAPRRFPVGVAIYLLINAAAGALAVGGAALFLWQPRVGGWALNGVIYGFIGQGVVRVEPRSPELRYVEAGRSVLARATKFVERFMEAGCELGLQRRLDTLDDAGLYDQAMYLYVRFIEFDSCLSTKARAGVKRQIVDAAEAITEGNRTAGRGRLEQICFQEIGDRQLHPEIGWVEVRPPPD